MPITANSVSTFCLSEQSLEIVESEKFGAQVHGFDASGKLSGKQLLALRVALIKHKMLLLRSSDKTLAPLEQVSLTYAFGAQIHTSGPSLRYIAECPEVFRIANRKEFGNLNTGQYWHSDGHFLEDPSAVTVMHMVTASPDGPTLIADAVAAYKSVPAKCRKILADLYFRSDATGVAHPIIKAHPVTGEIALYVNLNATAVDSDGIEQRWVKPFLDEHLSHSGHCVSHQWQTGDTIIIDNFSTAHKGIQSDAAHPRVMHRTTVTGASVWWRR